MRAPPRGERKVSRSRGGLSTARRRRCDGFVTGAPAPVERTALAPGGAMMTAFQRKRPETRPPFERPAFPRRCRSAKCFRRRLGTREFRAGRARAIEVAGFVAIVALGANARSASAESVVVHAAMDTTIYEETPSNSNGSGAYLFAGNN